MCPHPSHSRKEQRFGKLLVPQHRNRVPMPGHRTCGIGLFYSPSVERHCVYVHASMRARTIRVVFAAKLLEKLILYSLSSLSLPSIKAFVGTCVRSTIALLRKFRCPTDEFFRCHTQLQSSRLRVNTKYLSHRRGLSRRSTSSDTKKCQSRPLTRSGLTYPSPCCR
jgi:hypothetical protein